MKGIKRLSALLFAAVMLLPCFSPCKALPEDTLPIVSSKNAIVYNMRYGKVLYSKASDEQIYPAAFTKLMTALLGFEYYKEHGDVEVTVTAEMLSALEGSNVGLLVGENLPFSSLLMALAAANANDAALVIASTVGGSIPRFVEMMNRRAAAIGMKNTYYSNPTGIDSAVMYTTLSDTLALCLEVYKVNGYMVYSSLEKAVIPETDRSVDRVYTNKNQLIPFSYVYDYYIRGAQGMIAGYTGQAGYCVATVIKGAIGENMILISGGKDTSEEQKGTAIQSYYEVKKLSDWANSAFSVIDVAGRDAVIHEMKVLLGNGRDHVVLTTTEPFSLLMPSDTVKEEIEVRVFTDDETLTAPVVKGDVFGRAEYYYRGEMVGSVELCALTNVPRSTSLMVLGAIKDFFSAGVPKALLIAVISLAVLYVLLLFAAIILRARKNNRDTKEHLALIEKEEDARMREVKLREKEARRQKRYRFFRFFRAGFRSLREDEPKEKKPSAVHPSSPKTYRIKETAPEPAKKNAAMRNPAKK